MNTEQIEEYLDDYSLRLDNGVYTPTEHEKLIMMDFVLGLLDEMSKSKELIPVPSTALLCCPFCGGKAKEVIPRWNIAHAECVECGEAWGHCGSENEKRYERFNKRAT